MNVLKTLVWGVVVVLGLSVLALSQTGSIQGTVLDQTGAVVQGAEVTVRSLETNQTRTATSSTTGAYSIPNLTVGHYEVTIRKGSFKTFKVADLQLSVAEAQTVNAQLEPGAVTEELQVRADQLPAVDLETSQISNLVAAREIKDLPLITRDPYSLILLSPGTSQTTSYLGGFTVNGSRERNNNFLLDGVDNNDTSVPFGGGALSANPDSVEEFRVITDNFNAEYGRNTGAIIDVVTKSGTNAFHGGVYEFGRWNGFGGARDWFNRTNDPVTGAPQKMDPYIRNQFGYTFGGPIIKDKTFFFVNQEFQKFITTTTNSADVPTAAFKTGVFTYNGVPLDLTPGGANNAYGLPLDPTMQNVLALYPTPSSSADGLLGTVFFPSSSRQSSWQAVAKVDHHINDKHSLSLRYGYDYFKDPNPFHDDVLPGNVAATAEKSLNQGLLVDLTSAFRSNLINDFKFGWNRIYAAFDCTNQSPIDAAHAVDQFGYGHDYYIDPFTNVGCTDLVSNSQWRKTGTTSFTDTISWVKGAHTLKFGFDFRNVGEQGPNSFYSRRQVDTRTFAFTGFGLLQNEPVDANGDPFTALEDAASALYGFVWNDLNGEFFDKSGVRQATDNKHFRQHEYDWFGQDTWKLFSNFTLTLGLRYQLDGVPYEENANFSNLLTPPDSYPVVFSIVGPGTGKQLYQPDYSNIEPRIGFSWDPWKDGKTAVRAAFGIFHDRVFGNLFGNARGSPPFEQDWNTFPFETIGDAFGSGAFPTVVPDTSPSATVFDADVCGTCGLLAPVVFDTHFRNSASNNWNLGIQRELPGNNTLDLSYVGTKGTYIYRNVDGNPPDPVLVDQLVTYCSDVNNAFACTPADVSNLTLYYGGTFGSLPFNAVAHNALLQPSYQRSVGNSIYNALQLKITHRLSHGLQVQGSYTWAHGIDDASDPLAPAQGNRTFPRNSRDLRQDRSNSDNDIRQILVINYIWELPFGRGRSFANSGKLGKILEGMQFSGVTSIQGGHPFEVRCTRDSQRTGIASWCDLVGDPNLAGANSADTQNQKVYFSNPAAFDVPPFGRKGTIARNQFYGPGYVNFDLSFAKKTKLTERFELEFRMEGYNIFNHPHFEQPDNLQTSPTFGLISSTHLRPDSTTSARQMQAALKLNF
ncbi:MAG: TonB-dependent receptor [Acidobacteriia bacterium]|nr:TonB-dependent receptor [Terriglobia bacterium]